jgi:hypothetical protein
MIFLRWLATLIAIEDNVWPTCDTYGWEKGEPGEAWGGGGASTGGEGPTGALCTGSH